MDKEFLAIIFGIIGLITTGASTGVESKLWSMILVAVGVVSLGVSFSCYGYSFAYGMIAGGIIVWGSSFIFTKVKGESILTDVNWLTLIVGTIVAIIGGWILWK